MTRLWEVSEAIQMETDGAGMPFCFIWKKERHMIQEVGKRWRVDVGWWRLHIWREHYKLTTKTGMLVIVYHDLLTGRWYLQRLYD